MATLGDLITRTQELLSLAGGLGVQTYAQPKIIQYIRMGYNTLFDMRFWDDYTSTETYDLNGTDGRTVQDLTNILRRFRDFQYIWLGDYANPLPRAPDNRPPHLIRQVSFTTSATPVCLFKILPVTTTGQVHVRLRTKILTPFVETDEVPMDEELLVRWAAMMYVTSDNANTALTQMLTNLYTDRLNMLIGDDNKHSKSLYSYDNQTVDQWHDA